ncbi:hypothetical protein [Croceicoccus sp. Ery5]|uniref:hypothetical protein n=1 Tax=Croceicoccus sp. Ery5 TaxID=1703340 RepID=UPI001E3AF14E|nr:hypothetical protein [Croceicoccus sp. Ery5]
MSRSIVLMGTGGSSGRTLEALEQRLSVMLGDVRFQFVDTQPFNLRTEGHTAYHGKGRRFDTNMADVGMRRLSSSLSANLLLNGGPAMMRRLDAYAESILGKRHDAIVMVHDRVYIEQAFVRAAARLGTPSVIVQEGPFVHVGADTPQNPVLRIKHALAPLLTRTGLLPAISSYGFAGHDLAVVPSKSYRQRYIVAGMEPDRIAIGGVPRYDQIAELAARPAPSTGESGPLQLLYLFQPFGEHGKVNPQTAAKVQLAMIEGLNRAGQARDIHVTIRIHPRSTADSVAHLTSALHVPHTLDRCQRPIEQAIDANELVLGHYSSGLLEAMILSRSVLCIPIPAAAFAEQSEAGKQGWMAQSGAALAHDAAEVAAAVERYDRGAPDLVPPSALEDEVGEIDGRATDRCARAIADLIESRGPPCGQTP